MQTAAATGGTVPGGGGGGVLVLMALLPVVHLLSIASLDVLSRLPFLKVSFRFCWECHVG